MKSFGFGFVDYSVNWFFLLIRVMVCGGCSEVIMVCLMVFVVVFFMVLWILWLFGLSMKLMCLWLFFCGIIRGYC